MDYMSDVSLSGAVTKRAKKTGVNSRWGPHLEKRRFAKQKPTLSTALFPFREREARRLNVVMYCTVWAKQLKELLAVSERTGMSRVVPTSSGLSM